MMILSGTCRIAVNGKSSLLDIFKTPVIAISSHDPYIPYVRKSRRRLKSNSLINLKLYESTRSCLSLDARSADSALIIGRCLSESRRPGQLVMVIDALTRPRYADAERYIFDCLQEH